MKAKDCKECPKDNGWCVYCQKQFASDSNLHRHIEKQHPDTIRRKVCIDSEPYDFEVVM